MYKLSCSDYPKFLSAYKALDEVENNMKIGLGTGSTADWFVKLLAEKIESENWEVKCTTTSSQTYELAQRLGLPLFDLDELSPLDLVIDGADEVDANMDLIKGGGGALLQEKIVEKATKRFVVIADESKNLDSLGAFPLPVEVIKFGALTTKAMIETLLLDSQVKSTKTEFRMLGDKRFVTDEGHYIVDCFCEHIENAENLAVRLNMIPGVVETGLFIGMANKVIFGNKNGEVRGIERGEGDMSPTDTGWVKISPTVEYIKY